MNSKDFTCDICTDIVVIKEKSLCVYCKHFACYDCTHTYFFGKDVADCMFCQKKFSLDEIIQMSEKTWFNTIYKLHRSKVLMIEEKKKIPETIAAAKVYDEAMMFKHMTCVNGNRKHFELYDGYEEHWTKYDKAERLIVNANMCIDTYGKGWEGFDFRSNEPRPIQSYLIMAFQCPVNKCYGFVTDSICNLCNTSICMDCREVIKSKTHKCNLETLETLKEIFKDSKPCPKCLSLISKIEGCDQMFCTQCHTTYSWNSGTIVTNGFMHNPHYLAWRDGMKQNEGIKQKDDMSCDDYISFEKLLSCFSKQEQIDSKNIQSNLPRIKSIMDPLPSSSHYLIALTNLREVILNVRATSGNHANIRSIDNHDLRVLLLTNTIDEQEFSVKIEERDYEYKYYTLYYQIYQMVFNMATIIFDNFYVMARKKFKVKKSRNDILFETYTELQNILNIANSYISKYDTIFGKNEKFIKFSTYPY